MLKKDQSGIVYKMENELNGKIVAAIREQNGGRAGKAAPFLRENGATYLRGVYHNRSEVELLLQCFVPNGRVRRRSSDHRASRRKVTRLSGVHLRNGGWTFPIPAMYRPAISVCRNRPGFHISGSGSPTGLSGIGQAMDSKSWKYDAIASPSP